LRSWWLGKPPNESKWLELDLPILSPFQNWILKSTSSNLHTLSSLGSGSKPWYPDGTLKSSERYSLMPYNALYSCYSIAGWLFSQSYCICRGKLTHRSANAIAILQVSRDYLESSLCGCSTKPVAPGYGYHVGEPPQPRPKTSQDQTTYGWWFLKMGIPF
jgi:hypothetical protein